MNETLQFEVTLETFLCRLPYPWHMLTQTPYEYRMRIVPYVHRPGLLLVGYKPSTEYENHILLFADDEFEYIKTLGESEGRIRVQSVLRMKPPAILYTGKQYPPEWFIQDCTQQGIPLIHIPISAHEFISRGFHWLERIGIRPVQINGNLMKIFHVGVLILGESGIGKSECSLELITRGHQFVSDDIVELCKFSDGTLEGRSPEMTRGLMEIRGLGIIDVASLFGPLSVLAYSNIELVIKLIRFRPDMEPTSLESDIQTIRIREVNVSLPLIEIPVAGGRNLGILVETAVRWFSMKDANIRRAHQLSRDIDSKAQNTGDKRESVNHGED